jgi:Rieske Fe-S protein
MAAMASRSGRRDFLSWLLGTSFGLLLFWILYPVLRFLEAPSAPESSASQVEAGDANAPEFLEAGYKIVRLGEDPVILVRVADDDFRALSATCTHLGCIVEYQKDKQRIWCNCHNGVYDLSGRVVSGPPPRPLAGFKVDLVARDPGRPRALVVSRA